ncbi:MAG: ABC transporter permease subunit [Acidobacteriota bacterium]
MSGRWRDRALSCYAGASALLALGLFVALLAVLLLRGGPVLSWELLSEASSRAGAAGGLRYQILGTGLLIATAAAFAVPLAVALGLLSTVYLKAASARRLDLALYVANGIPSILFGLAGIAFFSRALDWGKSWLAGGIVLAMMILPTLTVAFAERVRAIPGRYLEAAYGLGLSRDRVVRAVILPQSFGGLVSGALLGLARAAGETAPILFTAAIFSGATVPDGIRDNPVLALPYHIFVLAQDSLDPGAGARLWGAALVLVLLVAGLASIALPARLRLREEAYRG